MHRVRPLLVDTEATKHASLLTNVPTELPVDDVCPFDELANPLRVLLPVSDDVINFLQTVGDALSGDGPDGFRGMVAGKDGRGEACSNFKSEFKRPCALRAWTSHPSDGQRLGERIRRYRPLHERGYVQRTGVPFVADVENVLAAVELSDTPGGFDVRARRCFRDLLTLGCRSKSGSNRSPRCSTSVRSRMMRPAVQTEIEGGSITVH